MRDLSSTLEAPAEVREVAEKLRKELDNLTDNEIWSSAGIDIIASALSAHGTPQRAAGVEAERKRCAAIARAMQPAGGRQWTSEQLACFSALEDCAKSIESAIRADDGEKK